jgi:Matrixin
MRRHAFQVGTVAIVFGPIAIALAAIPTGVPLSAARQPLDATRPITYFIANGSERTGFRSTDRQLARWAFDAWQRSADGGLRLDAVSEPDAVIRLYWADARDGQYGEMRRIEVGGRRGAAVFIRPDVDLLGPDIAERARADVLLRDTVVYLTCVHELGHALGLEHTRDFRDIMYFFGYGGDIVQYFGRYRAQIRSRGDITAISGLSDADVKRLRSMYPRQ